MSDLVMAALDPNALARLIDAAAPSPAVVTQDHRQSLSARLRAVPDLAHRRLDAWSVEAAGRSPDAFAWSARSARRLVAAPALRRVVASPGLALGPAVRDEIDRLVARAQTGQTRAGSLGAWLASLEDAARDLVVADAVSWAATLLEATHGIGDPWTIPASDAYYDVAGARTTLRGRRDLEVLHVDGRVVVRLRGGAPGPSAGAGLRADLAVCALADHEGEAPSRMIGLWPEAGVALAVDGTMTDVRAGARDLVRSAVVVRRRRLVLAA